jgi:nitrite reductase/ring-hydroxylating ferredoxin subunit
MALKGFVKVASLSKLAAGQVMVAEVSGQRVLVCNVDGDIFAVSEVCPHADGPLGEGYLTDNMIECPWHASVFDVKSGKVQEGPASTDLAMFEVEIEGDDIFVGPEKL